MKRIVKLELTQAEARMMFDALHNHMLSYEMGGMTHLSRQREISDIRLIDQNQSKLFQAGMKFL